MLRTLNLCQLNALVAGRRRSKKDKARCARKRSTVWPSARTPAPTGGEINDHLALLALSPLNSHSAASNTMPVSLQTIPIGGLHCDVYGLEELLRSPAVAVSVLVSSLL